MIQQLWWEFVHQYFPHRVIHWICPMCRETNICPKCKINFDDGKVTREPNG